MANEQKEGMWTDAEKQMLLRYALSGAAAGGAGGLITSYMNHMRELNKNVEAAEDDPYVDVAVPELQTKMATDSGGGWLWGDAPGATALGMAVPAMGLSGITSYIVARKMYQKFKAEETKKRLQDSEEAYVSSLQDQAAHMKSATSPSVWQASNMGILGAIPIAALASGFLTNKILDKNFPLVNTKVRRKKKFRLVNMPTKHTEVSGHEAVSMLAGQSEEDLDDDGTPDVEQLPEEVRESKPGYNLMKEASYTELDEADALESLCRTVLALPGVKVASELPDLIAMAGSNPKGVASIQAKYGALGLMRLIKGAADVVDMTDPVVRMRTIREACKSAAAPTIAVLAASEFNEAAPKWVHTTRHIHPDLGESLYKHAAVMGLLGRWYDLLEIPEMEDTLTKGAAAPPQQVLPGQQPPLPPSASIPPPAQSPTVNPDAEAPSGASPDRLADVAAASAEDSTVTPLEGNFTPSVEVKDNLTEGPGHATKNTTTPVLKDKDEVDGLMGGGIPPQTT